MKIYITKFAKYQPSPENPAEQPKLEYVDALFRLKPAAFMDMAQDLANKAADGIGFGYDKLQESGVAWVLSRMHFHFDRSPLWRDKARLSSWSKGPEGLFFLRDFRLESLEGELLHKKLYFKNFTLVCFFFYNSVQCSVISSDDLLFGCFAAYIIIHYTIPDHIDAHIGG